jgi:hypothetical protein
MNITTTARANPLLAFFGLLTMISVVLTPIVGIFGPFQNGQTGGSSNALFLPAGYAFSIWGVNYLGLFALGVWILLKSQRDNPRALRAAPWIFVTAVFNVAWILFAGQTATVPWTVPILIVMEVSAWIAYFALEVGNHQLPSLERRLHVPFQIYIGWLSVATVANSAAALNVLGWNAWGLSPVFWTVLMLLVATVVAYVVGALTGQDNVYRAVFVWAYVGIVVEQFSVPTVAWTAGAMALVVFVMILLSSRPKSGSILSGA